MLNARDFCNNNEAIIHNSPRRKNYSHVNQSEVKETLRSKPTPSRHSSNSGISKANSTQHTRTVSIANNLLNNTRVVLWHTCALTRPYELWFSRMWLCPLNRQSKLV